MDISNTDLNSDLNMDLPNINPLPDDGIPAASAPTMSDPTMDIQNTAPTMSAPSMDNSIPDQNVQTPTDPSLSQPNPDISAPEEEETINEESENVIKEGTELYYVNETLNYEFETTKLSDDKVGTWLFLTTKSAEKMSLEDWEDKFLYKYIVQESFEIQDDQKKSTEPCLYKELIINPDDTIVINNFDEFKRMVVTAK